MLEDDDEDDEKIKVIVVGETGVGKTNLINAVKGFEYGNGFDGASARGSEVNDEFIPRKNIALNRLNTRAICMLADALSAPPLGLGTFDMIVCNPPYIATYDLFTLDSSVKDFEPLWALDGGDDGLKFYRGIIKHWKTVLRPGGLMILEVGDGQAEDVCEMLLSGGFSEAETRQDSAGIERVVVGQLGE